MRSLTDIAVSPMDPLSRVIEVMNEGSVRLAVVLSEDGHLVGLISDGDLRRGLLEPRGMDSTASDVMNENFLAGVLGITQNEVRELLDDRGLEHLPIVTASGKGVGFFWRRDLQTQKFLPNLAFILAGGQGRRLRPHTDHVPKPMLEVAGKPLLEHIVESLKQCGFSRVCISVNYLRSSIEDYFGDGRNHGVQIEYVSENEPLGTAGSLSMLPPQEYPVLVINGDVLSEIDFKSMVEFHALQRAAATVGVRPYMVEVPYGVVTSAGTRVREIEEKPTWSVNVNVGVYVLSPEVIRQIPGKAYVTMTDVLRSQIMDKRNVCAFPIHERWLDIGEPSTLVQARTLWHK